MLPDDVCELVEEGLGEVIQTTDSLGGGCIAHATRLGTDAGTYFLKWSREEAARTFTAEAAGLRALREAGSAIRIPEPLIVVDGGDGKAGILLLEWIERSVTSKRFWEAFGHDLADLHRHSAERYGFHRSNYIGRLPQENEWVANWPEFFWTRRIEPQVRRAKQTGIWQNAWEAPLKRIGDQLDAYLPMHPEASVVHGDLWAGNFIPASDGHAALIDPATYFGHRETDLAMTRLFGGFPMDFYAAYQEAWPLEDEWEVRFEIYNLYHLINHLNHFGAGYASSIQRVLKRF